MSSVKLAPWHLWGLTQTVRMTSGEAVAPQTAQLCKIAYGRPETWRFCFVAKILGGATANGGQFQADFSVTIGAGRDSFTLTQAPRFRVNWVLAAVPIGRVFFTSQIDGPVLDDSIAPARPNVIQTVSASDIQVVCSAGFSSPNATEQVQATVGAFFSPETHIRPEWYLKNYPGEEHKPGW